MSLPVLPLFIPGRLLKVKNLNAQLKTRSTATANTRASYSLLIKIYTIIMQLSIWPLDMSLR